jgi:hypothetical protein
VRRHGWPVWWFGAGAIVSRAARCPMPQSGPTGGVTIDCGSYQDAWEDETTSHDWQLRARASRIARRRGFGPSRSGRFLFAVPLGRAATALRRSGRPGSEWAAPNWRHRIDRWSSAQRHSRTGHQRDTRRWTEALTTARLTASGSIGHPRRAGAHGITWGGESFCSA